MLKNKDKIMLEIYLKSGKIKKYKNSFLMKNKHVSIVNLLKYHTANGEIIHREDGPAINFDNKEKWWIVNGKKHRIDGPAVKHFDGSEEWWIDGKLHRLDGPALILENYKSWWINGKQLPTKDVEKWIKENKINLTTEKDQIVFKLKWG